MENVSIACPENNRTPKKRSLGSRFLRFMLRFLLVFFIASILQVLLYKWLPPLYTPKMVFDQVENYLNLSEPIDIRYQWRSFSRISPYMALAVIAAEDQRFPDHFGLDLKAIEDALKYNKKGQKIRGASTITQQVAKNLFLWPNRDYLRKGLEAYYALLIELFWSKQRIVEMYVNIAEMGYGIYGVEAASKIFYEKDSKKINRYEAALLAAVLPNPKRFSAKNPSGYILRRRDWILRQMRQLGDLQLLERL